MTARQRPYGRGGAAPGKPSPVGDPAPVLPGGAGAGSPDAESPATTSGAGMGPGWPPDAGGSGDRPASEAGGDGERRPPSPAPPPGPPLVTPGPHLRRGLAHPPLANLITSVLLLPPVAWWILSGALSAWCLAPLFLAPLAAFLLRSVNPPALRSLSWLQGSLAGLALLPAVWQPGHSPHAWGQISFCLLAGTGAALGAAAASLRPGVFRTPAVSAALLAALLPLAAGLLAGQPAGPAPRALHVGPAVGREAPAPGYGPPQPGGDLRREAWDRGRPAGAGGATGTAYRTLPAGAGGALADYPLRIERTAMLALAPLLLFLLLTRLAPRLPVLLFCTALAGCALPGGAVDWGAGAFWTLVSFLALPDLLRSPGKALWALLLGGAGAADLLASSGWGPSGASEARLLALGWCALLGIAAGLAKLRELRRLQAATVRALLLAHPRSLDSMPFGAMRTPPHHSREDATATALILCRRPPALPRASSPPNLTCAMLESLSGGPWACAEACLGAGDCVAACPSGAMALPGDGGPPQADPDRCVGCGLCALACPKGLPSLVPHAWKAAVPCRGRLAMKDMDALCGSGCLGCGLCRKACPKGAMAWRPPRAAESAGPAPRRRLDAGLALGARGGAKPSVNQEICLDPETGSCSRECRASCPRGVILSRDV
ncbi:MAG: 4Fe-4S dicluster domain-containing protein [Deltaproteobacteria bacterium]|jgi:ferredoxin|nr:4Fe-4S dicluster domain-containing protein [Deltaproteobacteria bacterium]